MGYAPPRIPLEQRREAIAAAEAKIKRGRSRCASSSRSPASGLARRSRSMGLILPTYYLIDPNSTSSLNSKRDPNARRTIGSGSPAYISGHGGGAKAAGQPSPSSSRSQTKTELTRTGARARSCPPTTRVVSPDSRMISHPRISTQSKLEGRANGSDETTSSVADDFARRHCPVTSKTRLLPPVNRNELCAKRSSSELALGTKARAKLGESGVTRSKSDGVSRKNGATMGSRRLQAHDAKQRFEVLRRQPGNSACADCGGPCADWASIAQGAFVCLVCAGHHRGLGFRVSFTRSLLMDQWTEGQLRRMEKGGNRRLSEFMRLVNMQSVSSIEDKYGHPYLAFYRECITALASGREPPVLDKAELRKAEPVPGPTRGQAIESKHSLLVCNAGVCGGALGNMLLSCSMQKRGRGAATVAGRVEWREEMTTNWVADGAEEACMLCERRFSILRWRHHCRRCGRLVCDLCAPTNNTRPIMEWGFSEPVRHCHECYRSPLVGWARYPGNCHTTRDGLLWRCGTR